MSGDAARVAEAREWLVRASRDLRGAEHALKADPPLVEDALFHCQQAAEKAMKGFLAWHDRPFGKTMTCVNWRRCVSVSRSTWSRHSVVPDP